MSLWTPYVNDVALDLSKGAVKEERVPSPESTDYARYPYQAVSAPIGYPYQYPVYVPACQLSPSSVGSGYSYEAPAISPAFRPQLSPAEAFNSLGDATSGAFLPVVGTGRLSPNYPRTGALSPPLSPETKRRCNYMVDADTLSEDPNYQAFERNALKVMAEKNGGSLLGNNPRMRRVVRSTNGSTDDEYRRQRERNNFAAKQSRDRRKLREVKLALKVAYLKNEVANLRASLNSGLCGKCQTTYKICR